jgi:hypothetical protein
MLPAGVKPAKAGKAFRLGSHATRIRDHVLPPTQNFNDTSFLFHLCLCHIFFTTSPHHAQLLQRNSKWSRAVKENRLTAGQIECVHVLEWMLTLRVLLKLSKRSLALCGETASEFTSLFSASLTFDNYQTSHIPRCRAAMPFTRDGWVVSMISVVQYLISDSVWTFVGRSTSSVQLFHR